MEMNINTNNDCTNPSRDAEMSEEQVDALIGAICSSPLCSRCGASIKGAPHLETFQCPRCKNHMRHVGRIWMEYVSPLDLSAAVPPAPAGNPVRRFNFTK